MNVFIAIKHAIGLLCHYYIKPQIADYGKLGINAVVGIPADLKNPKNVFLGDYSRIGRRSTIITVKKGRFIVGNNTGISEGLLVIASNHKQRIGKYRCANDDDNEYKNVTVGDDVWIGANVTLLAGTVINRGSIVGASSVCSKEYPPYAVIAGNPAKVIKFKMSIDGIIKHEQMLYPEDERYSKDELIKIFENNADASRRPPYLDK